MKAPALPRPLWRPKEQAEATSLRREAERHLVQLHLTTGKILLETDEHRLLHELQVHQVELEMQNAELQDARDRAEVLLAKYTDLYDFAPVGYLSLTAEGRIQLINLTGAALLGLERSRLTGQLLGPHLRVEDRAGFNVFLRGVFAATTRQSCEVTLAGPGLSAKLVNIEAQCLPETRECRVVLRDVTERRQTTEKMRVSEVRYRRLFEAAQDGVLLIDPGTRQITDANPFMTTLLGYPRDQLVGKELFEIGLLKDEAASREMFLKLKRKHEVRYENLPLESREGRHQEVEVVANLYEENGLPVIQCNIRDITVRKLAELALRASEERYRILFELCPVAVYSCDAEGLLVDYNQSARRLWGRRPMIGDARERFCGSFKLFTPRGRIMAREQCPMAAVLKGRLAVVSDAEVILERIDGTRLACLVNIRPLKDHDGKITGAINCFYDITERKQAEAVQRRLVALAAANLAAKREITRRRKVEVTLRKSEKSQRALLVESRHLHTQLRHLTRQLLTAQEDERKLISRELHDDVLQTLVGIIAQLSALTSGATVPPADLLAKIARTQQVVEDSVNAVHRFARNLRPAELDDLGLVPALTEYGQHLVVGKKLRLHLTTRGQVERLDSARRTVLFRVAQEALTNVARHAHASQVTLKLSESAGAVRMVISDNGRSFAVKKTLGAKSYKRLGLLGMRERLEMVGGSLAIESAPGHGTTLRAAIPAGGGNTIS